MSLRKQMMDSVSGVLRTHENTSLLLVDIGVWGFRDILKEFPERAFNIGVFEDGMVSVAAGLALSGITPFVYGISPFILGRAYEQLKLDFCYQGVGGNFIATGAAYDFSTLGYSHYCQEDVDLVKTLPGMELIAPGTPREFASLFDMTWNDGKPTYYRLTDHCNREDIPVTFGKASVIQKGTKATVIAVGTMLDAVMEACRDEDVTVLYYTTLLPFDYETLAENCPSGRILLCEPHYMGALAYEVYAALPNRSIMLQVLGMPREIYRKYGKKQDKDENLGLTAVSVKETLTHFICLE